MTRDGRFNFNLKSVKLKIVPTGLRLPNFASNIQSVPIHDNGPDMKYKSNPEFCQPTIN